MIVLWRSSLLCLERVLCFHPEVYTFEVFAHFPSLKRCRPTLCSCLSACTCRESFGSVESVKAASDVYAPVGGEVLEVNEVGS